MQDGSLRPGPALEWPLGRDEPEALGLAARRESRRPPGIPVPGAQRGRPRDLLAQAIDDRVDVDVRRRRNPCTLGLLAERQPHRSIVPGGREGAVRWYGVLV